MRLLAALLLLWPMGLQAEDILGFEPEVIVDCLEDGTGIACVGVGAEACIATNGYPAVGICFGAENSFWEARIEAATLELNKGEEIGLSQARRVGVIPDGFDVLSVNASWREAQKTICDYAGAIGGDMGFGFRWMECTARMAGAHALFLEGALSWVE